MSDIEDIKPSAVPAKVSFPSAIEPAIPRPAIVVNRLSKVSVVLAVTVYNVPLLLITIVPFAFIPS